MKKGITRRWLINTFGVILAIVGVLITVLSLILQNYYDNGIRQTLNGRVDELSNVFGNYTTDDSSVFETNIRSYIENFSDKESMELMVLDTQGNITVTSTGFPPDQNIELEDYKRALQDPDGYGSWTGKQNGETVMAVTRIITDVNGNNLGAVRYCVSFSKPLQIPLDISAKSDIIQHVPRV